MPAAELIALVAQLGAPYGIERSVKIAPAGLFADRCLISIHRSALGGFPAERLAAIARELEIPPGFADELADRLDGADVVHFGHEAGPGFELRKIYFEYAAQARRAMARGQPVLVHFAYKWALGRPDSASVTRYRWTPSPTRQAIEEKLRALLPADRAPRARHCALDLVSRVAPLAESGQLLMMEVEEPGNPRHSCDLNVYDAELRLGRVADLIDATTRAFAVPQAQARTVFEAASDVPLGHLSAGIGRDGEEFVTIYYGVEAH